MMLISLVVIDLFEKLHKMKMTQSKKVFSEIRMYDKNKILSKHVLIPL